MRRAKTKMKSIKFSHDYEKLPIVWQGTQAVLVGVYHTDVSKIKHSWTAFWKYDTTFRGEKGQYEFGFVEAIILSFIHLNTGKPFTTIRRYDTDKMRYYLSSMGETFQLEYASPLHNSVIEANHNDIGEAVSV